MSLRRFSNKACGNLLKRMSGHGTSRTYEDACCLAGFGGKADIERRLSDLNKRVASFGAPEAKRALLVDDSALIAGAMRHGALGFLQRRKLMDAWAQFCTNQPGKVVRLNA
jgi:hypothetical protein